MSTVKNMQNKQTGSEQNPVQIIRKMDKDLLCEIAQGRIDLRELARIELENRGLSIEGVSIGYRNTGLSGMINRELNKFTEHLAGKFVVYKTGSIVTNEEEKTRKINNINTRKILIFSVQRSDDKHWVVNYAEITDTEQRQFIIPTIRLLQLRLSKECFWYTPNKNKPKEYNAILL